jgi:hypothetical protein
VKLFWFFHETKLRELWFLAYRPSLHFKISTSATRFRTCGECVSNIFLCF